ncbi:hypothetical protein VP01_614g1 [Puccinia sorghi]|uniref:Uncharacterized protein n=1 Tax=Puccinia sorghi TaxID=27349 RepID=A0A0L6UGW1_9BASI|nr:hypothetical protein VP01_614g1 [Puccinia sorghi]
MTSTPTRNLGKTTRSLQNNSSIQRVDLLIQRFSSLQKKCETYVETERRGPIDIIGQHHSKEYHWLRLQSSLLPHLQQQIDDLLDSLHLSKLICPKILNSYQVNDQYLKELKIYRINGLHNCFRQALQKIAIFSGTSSEPIQQLKMVNKQFTGRFRTRVANTGATLMNVASLVSSSVQTILKWLQGSEFDLVQDDSPLITSLDYKPLIDMRVPELMALINATARCEEDGDHFAWDEFGIEPLTSKSDIEVTKLLIPIFKLCRLFFKHLSVPGIDRKSLPLYTHMSSQQLRIITELPSAVHFHLDAIMDNLRVSELGEVVDQVINLEGTFGAACNLILLHFAPIVPNSGCSPVRDEFRNWLTTWKTQFNIAVSNVVHCIQ